MLIAFTASSFAAGVWVDTWNKGGYYATNGEKIGFNQLLGRSETRVGINLVGQGSQEVFFIGPYAAAIIVASQDSNYWTNNVATGYGLRVMPFVAYQPRGWADEWIKDVKLFGEVLELSFLKDESTAKTNKVPTTDKRFGLDLYHEWNQQTPDPAYPWVTVWTNLSYRTTDFYQYPDGFKTYRVSYEQRTGFYLPNKTIKPYLRTDFNIAGKPEPWLNNILVGPGIQVEPIADQKLSFYLEMLSIIWYKEPDSSRPKSDIRFGVEYRLYQK
ncbi:hypothetical protein A2276_00630 [candidate division WOR-1 bacterium RIFOXYA12_FULL_43_27]|uniref:Uncharacterized protein n=1 Tax=candidate division WOR-1 bacterium RIFOXYC2_FULL_46_14 TaxID=1802587 RepID=A0A1F4U4G0_UNCSA|nr:MAG: hypothetical protein A2276_00630 [candidate division WOR-1 bacterium RIFOXYA12_FULL_43_27]OGC20803.1 MAG: hypothetical protein A2292_07245 [candidate division WOR-1 bacterium RIFOXYB2_FULL_46_45]OGC31460.1 MAG: hypothetical protein A2232_04205 [candidate division WOR-1 bacterium RIFOXYA2_FULL_46_56]OGC39865.1 MAG: hypothetical protein A2438_05040 [candidate division WOR-1 bacterium RIFOXYC2_FULL_46_14]